MKLIISVFALMAVAIAAPAAIDTRSDTAPVMMSAAGEVVPFDSAGVNAKE
ncbi:hypothetical protein FQN55_000382 [Onygenales sp. PD_40]|nr:hypothetical protein FQN55_000382 [Onygenales sp. PD_40]KAK2792259.1 hypothetical protein FQN52_003736 [Onygenales sp. PD_12]KAK2800579.1 hypothetical protein FQN51_005962 [Onygenales sp. PD_10]KAK2808392.1 hypothetical protein FQN50_004777 [Emmonsiellopsis sp. PD_5]